MASNLEQKPQLESSRGLSLDDLQVWGEELGFSQIGVSSIDLTHAEPGLTEWLEKGFHGEMEYMSRHGLTRARPCLLYTSDAADE